MLFSRLLSPLIIPLVIVFSALWLRATIAQLPETYLLLIGYLPHVLLVVSGFLCLQFNQLRSLLITITLSISCLIIQLYLQNSLQENTTLIVFILLTTMLPVLLLLISWFPERGVLSVYGLLYFAIICLPLALAIYLYQNPSLLTTAVLYFPIREWEFSVLSPLAVIIFLFSMIHQLGRLWLYQQPIDAALSVILLSLLINFVLFDQTLISIVIFSALQLIIIWAVLKQSHDMAYRDELTGLPGRRALNEALKSPGRKYVLAMMDIDHFKNFNDKYGHDIGDDVLKIVASKMAQISGGGRAYRYGGEEFTVLFKGKELESCIPHLEAVRAEIASYLISIRENKTRPKSGKEGKQQRGKQSKPKSISVTISIGVAKRTANLLTPEQVLKAADNALYKAKNAGRNCLIAAK